jgi:hypothetical protein
MKPRPKEEIAVQSMDVWDELRTAQRASNKIEPGPELDEALRNLSKLNARFLELSDEYAVAKKRKA